MRWALALAWIVLRMSYAQVVPPPPKPDEPQTEKPAEKLVERPLLLNTGKPMQAAFTCSDDDMQWAGMSCSEDEPCPVYLELSSVEAVGNRIFAAGNLHGTSTTLYSVLLSSEDAGKTWQEPYDRIRGVSLDRIQFIDFETGWVSGQTVFPLTQDPFLLITSDSGKTWRKRPIFGESRAGAIQQFWFSSRTNGALLIDRSQSGEESRYELYESPNGGESWSLREVNERPLKLKHSFTPNTDWRIHADAATKSFRIERRQGEKWHAVASFLVRVGTCKPVPPVEAPPPVTAPAAPPAPEAKPKPPSLRRPPRG